MMPATDNFTIILLAAGASRRMRGRDKLLETIDGQPLLKVMAERAREVCQQVLVALAPDTPRAAALSGQDVKAVFVTDAQHGMGHSIAAAARALPPNTTAAMIVPTDMPEITAAHMRSMFANFDTTRPTIRRATGPSGAGHPVVFSEHFFDQLAQLTGDTGAREILRANADNVHYLHLPGDAATLDLDTPEAWEDWRKGAQ